MTLNDEQRERLKPYEQHLRTALYASYVVGLPSKVTAGVLWPVYKEVFSEHPGNHSCGECIVRVCQRLGRLYFADDEKEAAGTHETTADTKTHTTRKKTPQKARKTPKNKPAR